MRANEFAAPEFLTRMSPEYIHEMLIKPNLPEDLNCCEGSDEWNITYACSYAISYMVQYCIVEALKQIWPEFSYGDYALYHSKVRAMSIKKGSKARGTILAYGNPGTYIEEGTMVSTEAVNGNAAVTFVTTSEVLIDENGCVRIPIEATAVGASGNVPAGTIICSSKSKIKVNNPEALDGGTNNETITGLIDRMVEHDRNQSTSYIGNISDYIRWATEVPGIGKAFGYGAQLDENGNSNGTVTLICLDDNCLPFSSNDAQALHDVYDYIMSPNSPLDRKAPIAKLVVNTAEVQPVSISSDVYLADTVKMSTVKDKYNALVNEYLTQEAIKYGEVKYSKVYSLLSEVDGVIDFKNFTLNGALENVGVDSNSIAVVDAIDFKKAE